MVLKINFIEKAPMKWKNKQMDKKNLIMKKGKKEKFGLEQ